MKTISNRMTYVHFTHPGGPEVLQLAQGPIPKPGKGEVLIQVKAAGVNRPDLLQRLGQYNPPPHASPILGLEVAGTVVECGTACDSIKTGEQVCALVAGGGYAEYCVAPAVQCLPIPQGFTWVEAAAIPETFFTVWSNVFMRGNLQSGETILVHGGSSGIGTTAIQLAKAFGARVFVTAGSDSKCEACLQLGATGAINYKTHDFLLETRRLNNGNGVDLILDMIGGDYFEKNLKLLNPDGRIIQIAVQRGGHVDLPLFEMMAKRATITGSTLRPQNPAQKGKIADQLKLKVWPLLEEKRIRVVLDHTYPISQVSEAHRRLETSLHIGKVVLTF